MRGYTVHLEIEDTACSFESYKEAEMLVRLMHRLGFSDKEVYMEEVSSAEWYHTYDKSITLGNGWDKVFSTNRVWVIFTCEYDNFLGEHLMAIDIKDGSGNIMHKQFDVSSDLVLSSFRKAVEVVRWNYYNAIEDGTTIDELLLDGFYEKPDSIN